AGEESSERPTWFMLVNSRPPLHPNMACYRQLCDRDTHTCARTSKSPTVIEPGSAELPEGNNAGPAHQAPHPANAWIQIAGISRDHPVGHRDGPYDAQPKG